MKISEIIRNARDEYLWDGTGNNNSLLYSHKYAKPLMAIQFYLCNTFGTTFKDSEEIDVIYSNIVKGYHNVLPESEDSYFTKNESIKKFNIKDYDVVNFQNERFMFMTLLAILAEEQGL